MLSLCALAVTSLVDLLFPQMIRVLIDAVAAGRATAILDRAALTLLGLFLLHSIASALRTYGFATSGEIAVADLRRTLYSRFLQREIAFFDRHRTGEIVHRLTSDAAVLQELTSSLIQRTFVYVTQFMGSLGLLIWTSPRLAVTIATISVPLVALSRLVGTRVREISRQYQLSLATAGEIAQEGIGGIRTVRAFAREEHESSRFSARILSALKVSWKRWRYMAGLQGVMSLTGSLPLVAVLWFGGRSVSAGALSLGALTSFLVYVQMFVSAANGLSTIWIDLMRGRGTADWVFRFLDERPKVALGAGKRLSKLDGRIEFRGVRFHYPEKPDRPVLDDLNLTIEAGEMVALVGPSGGGKTTIVSLIQRFYDATAGTVSLDGEDVRSLEPNWLHGRIGFVAQEPILMSGSIRDNILYGKPDAGEQEVIAAAKTANAHDFVMRIPEAYDAEVGERGIQLSIGQKQRVAIARALVGDPRILILDEATSALDAESEELVRTALDRAVRGRTTIVIAHRLSTVAQADRVMVIDRGRVVESGTHATLAAQDGVYRNLLRLQFIHPDKAVAASA